MTDTEDHRRPDASGYVPYKRTNSQRGVRHARENAISDRLFERLISASYELDPDRDLETRLILLVMGRLGLRVGELVHLERDWLDVTEKRLEIPYQQPCTRGRDGGLCGTCRQHAQQRVEKNDGLTIEEATELQWLAKTEHAARTIPYDWSLRVALTLETYLEKYPRWMYSRSAITRRVNWLIDLVPEAEGLHPHALRATAASYQAGRGLDIFALKQFMGWADQQTAQVYIDASAAKLDRSINFVNR